MIQERQQEFGTEILDGEIARPPLEPLCREAYQQREAVGVSGDGVRTGVALAR
jgi:hypothetical protein